MAVVVMIRYPVFSFEGGDLWVFDRPEDVRHDLEVYDIDNPDIILDSEGHKLITTASGSEVVLSASDADPNEELLRTKLINALRKRGQYWNDDSSLEELITHAQATWWKGMSKGGLRTAFSGLLRLFGWRSPRAP